MSLGDADKTFQGGDDMDAGNTDESPRWDTFAIYPAATPEKASTKRFAGLLRALRLAKGLEEDPQPYEVHAPLGGEDSPNERKTAGMCLSGGGIRSASYSLGVLQVLEEADMVRGERGLDYLSAVSGGSFTATAVSMVALGKRGASLPSSRPSRMRRAPASGIQSGEAIVDPNWVDNGPDGADGRPFYPGTPEERLLRNRTLYLTHGPGRALGVAWRVFLGILLNVAIVAAIVNTVARLLGWLYGWRIPSLRSGCTGSACSQPFSLYWPLAWTAVALAGLAVVVGAVWIAKAFDSETWRRRTGAASGVILGLAAAVALFGVGIPELLHWLQLALHTSAGTGPQTAKATTVGTAAGGGAALLSFAAATVWRLLTKATDTEKKAEGIVKSFVLSHRTFFINAVALLAGPVLLISLGILTLHWGAAHPPGLTSAGTWQEVLRWALPFGLLVVIWRGADLTAWSLHSFYQGRLAAAFALCRIKWDPTRRSPTAVGTKDACEDARPRSLRNQPRLSDSQPDDGFPEILICAAANISDYGETPSGSNVTSFVLGPKVIGGPTVGARPTKAYQDAFGSKPSKAIGLPLAMAISSAAVSPSMGKMTRRPFRFLLAVANVRLGVWLPNPRRVGALVKTTARRVFPLRPRPQYLIREMLGRNHIDAPFLYLTDGGHYENLGLVELIRRKCGWIWCIDGSGDKIDTFNTLGEAIAIARAELQAEITIDPRTDMALDNMTGDVPQNRYVTKPYCRGTIRYADGTRGTLIVLKAAVSRTAPWDVRSFQDRHPVFPCDPTINQLFDAERFDAYRELGRFTMEQALSAYGADYYGFIARRQEVVRQAGPPPPPPG